MKTITNAILASLARTGSLGIGIPASKGGSGGDLSDLFHAVAEAARVSPATARILAAQRHFAEVLLPSENVGLAEYRLTYIPDGTISGACTATWPVPAPSPLATRTGGAGWRVSGRLQVVPNVGEA